MNKSFLKSIKKDIFYRKYFYNFISGSLPSLTFFLFFPYYSKYANKGSLEFTLKVLPIFAFIFAIDLGINRVIIRISKFRSKELYLQKVISTYFFNILFYGYLIVIPFYFIIENSRNLLGSIISSDLYTIILFSPLLIASNIFFTYFDSVNHSRFNNLIASPLLASTWIILFFVSLVGLDTPTIIIYSFICPKLILLLLQVLGLPFKIQISKQKPSALFLKDKVSRNNFISSILSPLCSNLDRLASSFLLGSNSNWLIIYNGLSEISRKTGGLIRPIARIYYQLSEMTEAEKIKLKFVNRIVNVLNIVFTIILAFFFLYNSGYITFGNNDRSVVVFSLLCGIVFIVASFLQVNSSINFLLALIKGKLRVIIKYQILQIVIMVVVYSLFIKLLSFIFFPLLYLFMRISDYSFLRKINDE